jgi:hypothetical protein
MDSDANKFVTLALASPGTKTLVLPMKKAKGPKKKMSRYNTPTMRALVLADGLEMLAAGLTWVVMAVMVAPLERNVFIGV